MNICLGSSVVGRNSDSGHVGLQEDFPYDYKGATALLEFGELK